MPFHHDFAPLLAAHRDRLVTRRIVLARGAVGHLRSHLDDLLPAGPRLVVADPVTAAVAGDDACRQLAAEAWILPPAPGADSPVCDAGQIARLTARLRAGDVAAVVAVGSGTVNDIAKMACHRAGLPYAVLATAPSMNGYTSSIAAILEDGVKTTQPCPAPVVCVCDPELLAAAPQRLIASGYGDLLSKPVSNADWRLAHELCGDFWNADTLAMVERGNALLAGVAPALGRRDPDAVARLTASLLISGLAMTLAGTSSPASGGEHLISHCLDMTHFAFGEGHDLHGCQVGVATLVTSAFYERLLALEAGAFDMDAAVAVRPPWPEHAAALRQAFGPVADAVLPQSRQLYREGEALRAWLASVVAAWPRLRPALAEGFRGPAAIRLDLEAAGCPADFAAIGVSAERARRAILRAPDIRARYTVLHLLRDLGWLDAWTAAVLPAVRGPG